MGWTSDKRVTRVLSWLARIIYFRHDMSICFFCDGNLDPLSKDAGKALIDKAQKYTRQH